MTKKVNKAIYIVMGRGSNSLGERFNKLLSLQKHYEKVTPIFVGNGHNRDNRIEVKPLPNPTGFLRLLGLKKLKRVLDRYLFFPSAGILYVGRMKKVLERRIEDDIKKGLKVCLIVNTPPHCVGLIGLSLKRKFPQIYWIMDWTDLWTYDENYLNRTPPLYRKRLFRLEKCMLSECDMNVTTNSFARNVLINIYYVPSQRVTWINHAFSSDDAPAKAPDTVSTLRTDSDHEIKIVFFGTLFKPPRVPGDRVVEAIRHVRNAGINVVLHNYGMIPEAFRGSVMCGEGVVYHGMIDYKEGLKAISQCDFQLLVLADLPNSKAVMSIKLPDYFLVKSPIIAIVPEPSAISDVIKKTNSGYVLPANHDWGVQLEDLLRKIKNGASIPVRDEEEVSRYDWKNISRQWRNIIDAPETGHQVFE